MLRYALSLRFIMLVASFGTALGAIVLFFEGCATMVRAAISIFTGSEGKDVIAHVMGGTDVFLFASFSSSSPTRLPSGSSSI